MKYRFVVSSNNSGEMGSPCRQTGLCDKWWRGVTRRPPPDQPRHCDVRQDNRSRFYWTAAGAHQRGPVSDRSVIHCMFYKGKSGILFELNMLKSIYLLYMRDTGMKSTFGSINVWKIKLSFFFSNLFSVNQMLKYCFFVTLNTYLSFY